MINQELLLSLKLILLFTDRLDADSHWNYQEVMSPFSRIMVGVSGEGYVYHSGKRFRLGAGEMVLVPKYTLSSYSCEEAMQHYYILFDEEIFGGESIYDLFHLSAHQTTKPEDLALAKRLYELHPNRKLPHLNPKYYDNRETLYQYRLKNNILESRTLIETQGILLQLFSRFIAPDHQNSESANSTQQQMVHTHRFMEQNLHRPLLVRELAEEVHLNVDYFTRMFKRVMGCTPISYINRRRVERAKQLISTSALSLQAISAKVGIESHTYFFSLFKRYTGSTPAQYREQCLKQWSYPKVTEITR